MSQVSTTRSGRDKDLFFCKLTSQELLAMGENAVESILGNGKGETERSRKDFLSEIPGDIDLIKRIDQIASDCGVFLYWICFPKSQQGTLQVFIDKEEGVTFEACSKVSKKLLDMDELPPFGNLEVSSPGIERALLVYEHFAAAIGKELKIVLKKGRVSSGNTFTIEGTLLQISNKDDLIVECSTGSRGKKGETAKKGVAGKGLAEVANIHGECALKESGSKNLKGKILVSCNLQDVAKASVVVKSF